MTTTWEVWERIAGREYLLAMKLPKTDAEEMAASRKKAGKDVWLVEQRVLRRVVAVEHS